MGLHQGGKTRAFRCSSNKSISRPKRFLRSAADAIPRNSRLVCAVFASSPSSFSSRIVFFLCSAMAGKWRGRGTRSTIASFRSSGHTHTLGAQTASVQLGTASHLVLRRAAFTSPSFLGLRKRNACYGLMQTPALPKYADNCVECRPCASDFYLQLAVICISLRLRALLYGSLRSHQSSEWRREINGRRTAHNNTTRTQDDC